ncbi:hypothetical protein ACFO25_06370 [Paenactinomyces guangxiensis]|uniref:galactosylceramidase n=1 Tax=Paenactinomyces guangxiensis TaxID=1490290 RepID=A0A7W2A6F4_9BACL|nr:hypothetical protein [Paenactinomyces guangxiensis]MBA4493321.1 hypothetical protein [Paenactinomyces guangxiensis]MBH8589828.1 hypothetical protein [Paenactinomyces guangxiensis]
MRQARYTSILVTLILLLSVAFSPFLARDEAFATAADSDHEKITVNIDGSVEGRVWEGLGYVSSSGSTKLLMDYPEKQRQDIIDFLFKPNFGAGLNHYKMEIGSDANSSSGTEPSHMRSKTDFDITRGAGLWLAQKAKKANPDLLLDALRWGTPKWVAQGTYADKYLYYKNFLQGARDHYGLEFDYLGPDQNEGAFDRDWVVNVLRPGLNRDGFANVKLVAKDAVGTNWSIATQLKNDPALDKAIYSLGEHYTFTSSADAKQSGKPLWHSEARPPMRSVGLRGSAGALEDVAKGIMAAYVNGKMTKVEFQPFIEAWYDNVVYNTKGALVADKPWSGHYEIGKGVWIAAHFTQFARPGWKFVDSGSAVGPTFNYVTLKKPDDSGDYSIIVTNVTSKPQTYTFNLSGGLSTDTVHVWRTNEQEDFTRQKDIKPVDSSFSITIEPYALYSLTTTTGQQKGRPKYGIPKNTNLQLPYEDNFDSYKTGKQPKYAMDQGGAFEIADRGLKGKALRQVITSDIKPVDWVYRESPDPYTILGDSEWTNYSVSSDISLEGNKNGYAFVAGRVVDNPSGNLPPLGYNLKLSGTGSWVLRKGNTVLTSGTLDSFDPSQWHNVKLTFLNGNIKASVDGKQVTSYSEETGGIGSGMIALGSGYHYASFDNLRVEAINAHTPVFSKRIDSKDASIRYGGEWEHVHDSYIHYKRTLSKAKAGDHLSIDHSNKGTGLHQFQFFGNWSSGSNDSWSNAVNAYYQVRFKGKQAKLYMSKAPNHGIAAISIDGGPETKVDLYSPSRQEEALVYTSPELPAGEHSIKVRVTGEKNEKATNSYVTADKIEIKTGVMKQADLQYTFHGSGISIIGVTEKSLQADVYLDGKLVGKINGENAPTGYKRVLYRITGLKPGRHHLKYVANSPSQVDALEVIERVPPRNRF